MKLPYAAHAAVEASKVDRYLLSPTHAHGRHKHRVFSAAGYTPSRLAEALCELARESEDVEEVPSPFGRKFIVRGTIPSEKGGLGVATVWMLREGNPPLYFVTAYPSKS